MSEEKGGEPSTNDLLKDFVVTRAQFEDVVFVPVLAVVVALVLGGVVMLATGVNLPTIGLAFQALFIGSVGSITAISETLTAAAPVTLAALGMALGFRAGLFNIGAEGQMLLGGMAAVVVGFSFAGLPAFVHLPLALLAGVVIGGLYGAIPGWLKATTGAHEVITTIMLNLIASQLVGFLLRNPPVQKPGRHDPVSQSVLDSAVLPKLLTWLDPNLRLNAGIIIVIVMVVVIYWLLFRTTLGFEFRASGLNPSAAHYAGMKSSLIIVIVMAIAGGMAGLAGGVQVLGVLGRATPGFSGGALTTRTSRHARSCGGGNGSHSPRLLSISRKRRRTWRARSASVFNPHGVIGCLTHSSMPSAMGLVVKSRSCTCTAWTNGSVPWAVAALIKPSSALQSTKPPLAK